LERNIELHGIDDLDDRKLDGRFVQIAEPNGIFFGNAYLVGPFDIGNGSVA